MKTRLLLLVAVVMLFASNTTFANHINGGYISYKVDPQNPLKYEFTFTLFTNVESNAEDPAVQISMGDLNQFWVPRVRTISYHNSISIDIYEWEHTYSQPGNYMVSWNGIGRNPIVNATPPNAQLSQFIHTWVQARLISQNNNSAKTIIPAHFEAFVGEPFKMNMIAYDADGDRLTYELVPPQHIDQNSIPQNLPGYQFPVGLYINKFGELHWQNPAKAGPYSFDEYAISVKITEYKGDQAVGYTIIDLNIRVRERENQPIVKLLNKDHLTINYDGSVYAKPEQQLKLEFFVAKAPNSTNPVYAKQFSDLDTLDLATPVLTARDSANGLAVTLRLTPETSIARNEPYIIGLRGGALTHENSTAGTKLYAFGWDFVNVYIGAQQPTSIGDQPEAVNMYVYPNPVADKIFIDGIKQKNASFQIWNVMGQLIVVTTLKAGKNIIKRPSHLASGTYFYYIVSNGRRVKAGKLFFD